MHRISFLDNLEFLKNSTAKPYIIQQGSLEDLQFNTDLTISIQLHDRRIQISDKLTKAVLLHILGISGILKKFNTSQKRRFFLFLQSRKRFFLQNKKRSN